MDIQSKLPVVRPCPYQIFVSSFPPLFQLDIFSKITIHIHLSVNIPPQNCSKVELLNSCEQIRKDKDKLF